MKVEVRFTLDVDRESWDENYYGYAEENNDSVRGDVQDAAIEAALEYFSQCGVKAKFVPEAPRIGRAATGGRF